MIYTQREKQWLYCSIFMNVIILVMVITVTGLSLGFTIPTFSSLAIEACDENNEAPPDASGSLVQFYCRNINNLTSNPHITHFLTRNVWPLAHVACNDLIAHFYLSYIFQYIGQFKKIIPVQWPLDRSLGITPYLIFFALSFVVAIVWEIFETIMGLLISDYWSEPAVDKLIGDPLTSTFAVAVATFLYLINMLPRPPGMLLGVKTWNEHALSGFVFLCIFGCFGISCMGVMTIYGQVAELGYVLALLFIIYFLHLMYVLDIPVVIRTKYSVLSKKDLDTSYKLKMVHLMIMWISTGILNLFTYPSVIVSQMFYFLFVAVFNCVT